MPKATPLIPMSDLLRAEVQGELVAAGASDPQAAADRFYAWAKGAVHEDAVSRRAVGLELIATFKEEFPAIFRTIADTASTKPADRPQPEKPKRYLVDLEREQNVPVGISSYTFRPRAIISDPYFVQLAEEHGIPLIEK